MQTILTLRPRAFRATTVASWLLAASLLSTNAGAQTPDARWQPWLGCWIVSEAPRDMISTADNPNGLVCVVPGAQGVDIVTIANGLIVHREPVNATGSRVNKTRDNCPGWESATWSQDGRRLLMRSEYSCGAVASVKGSGVFAMTALGDWVQVQGTTIGTNASARVVRYRPAGVQLANLSSIPAGDSVAVRTMPAEAGFATRTARIAAGETVGSDDIIEVSKHVEAAVAESWLIELEQEFSVNGKDLVKLADQGMPGAMIDLMVALSYPDRFSVDRSSITDMGASEGRPSGSSTTYGRSRDYRDQWDCGYGDRMLPYGYYGGSCYAGYYGYRSRSRFFDYGFPGYWDSYNYGRYPIVITVRDPDSKPQVKGRAVNGSGYTQGSSRSSRGSGSSGTSAEKSSSGSSSSTAKTSGSSSSGSSSSGSSSSGSSSSGSSSGRTAKSRPPG